MYYNDFKLFQRSNESIWTDEYISKSMVNAHLDETHDAASRKYDKRMNIVNWINNKVKPNSKIIDLGCGPGLYSHLLGKLGHSVLGIDFNKESINYAQGDNKFINTVQHKYCNYLKDNIEGKFDAAIMIYCDFGALIPDEQEILLDKLNNLLDGDSLLFFDVFGKNAVKDKNEKRSWYISQGGDFWSKDPYLFVEERKYFENESAFGNRYFLINQINHEIKEFITWDQYYDEQSIRELLLENGFETLEIKNDLIVNDEETLFIMARKRR